ncbi:MAG: PAS domain S-box protein [Spirochaetes bacterium]|nr:PAS domain S-box protein [Spirochaetota bacterium]
MVKNSPDLIVMQNPDGSIAFMSDQCMNVLGHSAETIQRNSVWNYIHQDDLQRVKDANRKAFCGEAIVDCEYRMYDAAGECRWISQTARPVFVDNTLFGIVSSVRNISNQKKSESLLRYSEQKYRALTQQNSDGVSLIDESGIIIDWNNALERISGIAKDKAIGKPVWEIHYQMIPEQSRNPEQLVELRDKIRHALASGDAVFFNKVIESRIQQAEEVHYIQQSMFPIKTETGFQIGSIIRDITPQKKAELELRNNEKALQAIFNASVEIIILLNTTGVIHVCNEATAKRFAKEAHELIGVSIDELPIGNVTQLKGYMQQVIDKHEPLVFIDQQGRSWYENHLYPVFDDDDEVYYIVVYAREITERVQADEQIKRLNCSLERKITARTAKLKMLNQALSESEQKFRVLSEQSIMGIMIIHQGHILYENQAMADIFGYTIAEMLGWPLLDHAMITHPDDLPDIKELAGQVRAGIRKTINVTYRIVTKDRRIKWVDAFARPIIYEGKESIFLNMADVTERKDAEEHDRILREKVVEAEKLSSLGQLAAGIAHEIAQPLSGIHLMADSLQLLSRGKIDNPVVDDRAAKVKEYVKRINNLVDHIRTFSREQSNDTVAPFDLNESISYALDLVEVQYRNHNIDLAASYSDLPCMVLGNLFRFEQVVLNLLSNARYAVEEKARTASAEYRKTIRILSHITDDGKVLVKVRDNGMGIPDDFRKKIFDPYFSTKPTKEGTGLGLSIVYGIVSSMGGEIYVESEYGAYSEFVIHLTLQK